MSDYQDPVCGVEYNSFTDIETDIDLIFNKQRYAFIALPLSEVDKDFHLEPLRMHKYDFDWCNKVLGVMPDAINVDSDDQTIRIASQKLIEKNFKLAMYIGTTAVMINLNNQDNSNLARLCTYYLHNSHGRSMWVRIKVDGSMDDAWRTWNKFITSFPQFQNKIGLVLELGSTLPSDNEIKRWRSEILLGISLSTELFVTNKDNYPVLRREYQTFIKESFRWKSQIIINGADKHGKGMDAYQKYIYHLYETRPLQTVYQNFSSGYEDFLQIPLQPLKDNLDNSTYEIFEKDPIKYKQYEEAIYQILLDRGSPVPGGEPEKQVIMVVGAGRGPLVRASLTASHRSKIPVKVYAVEKNECALITLRHMVEDPYFSEVSIIDSDMRNWNPPELADILVSELLGSFSDNELSPECLDGAQRLLKKEGLSVPCEYTSYLAPLSSRRLFNAVTAQGKEEKNEDPFHMGYVVHLNNCYVFDKIKKCFVFEHPKHDQEDIDNSRHEKLEFSAAQDVVLHGFAGYFDAKLYRDIYISTHPETHSKDMFSWFPMYFPVKNPYMVRKGEKIVLDFWRVIEETKIWYEWAISEPNPLPIHNSRGTTYWIGL